jgi:hypothetical protein
LTLPVASYSFPFKTILVPVLVPEREFMSTDQNNRNRVKGAEIDLGPEEAQFWIASLVSGRTLEPVVEFQWDDKKVQMPPEKAMEMSWWMYEAANNSLFDAFLYDFVINKIGANPEQAAAMITGFRNFRDDRQRAYQSGFEVVDQLK